MIGTTRARVSFFMNKFRKLGLIAYNGHIEVHSSLLNVILHEEPHHSAPSNLEPISRGRPTPGQAERLCWFQCSRHSRSRNPENFHAAPRARYPGRQSARMHGGDIAGRTSSRSGRLPGSCALDSPLRSRRP